MIRTDCKNKMNGNSLPSAFKPSSFLGFLNEISVNTLSIGIQITSVLFPRRNKSYFQK